MANKFIIKGIRKFNEQKVIENTLMLINKGDDNEVKRRYNEPTCGEVESYTLMIEGLSTQGITIKQMFVLLLNCLGLLPKQMSGYVMPV